MEALAFRNSPNHSPQYLYNSIMIFPLLRVQTPAAAPTGLETPITYSQPAKTIAAVLADLSKSANTTLRANAEARKEVVLISVQNLPLKSLMDKIAFVTSCAWRQTADSYTLEPAQSVRNKEETEEIAKRTETARKEIQKKVDDLAKAAQAKATLQAPKAGAKKTDGDEDDGGEEAGAFGMSEGGDEKAIVGILQLIDPAVLAQIEGSARAVWATNNATQVQIALGGEPGAIVQNWVAEHNASVPKDASAVEVSPPASELPKPIADMMNARLTAVTQPVSKAILIARTMPFGVGVQLTLKAFGSDGKVLLSGDAMLGSAMFQDEMKQATSAKAPDASGGSKIEYSDDSRELKSMGVAMAVSGQGGKKISSALRAKLLHPELYDPLSFAATDVYRSVAKARHRQLVADLPDKAFGQSALEGLETFDTVDQAEAAIAAHKTVQAADDGQFLYVRPAAPAEDRFHRVDRVALRALLQATETKLAPGLDAIADFSLTSEDPMRSGLLMAYFSIFCTQTLSGMMMNGGETGWPLYQIYGSLEPAERQLLRSGGSIPFSGMNSVQQGYCAAYLYGSGSAIEADGAAQSHDMISRLMSRMMGSTSDYRDEPTEVMPNGLPTGGSLACSASSEPIVFTGQSDGKMSNLLLGPEELAMFRMFAKMAKQTGQDMGLPKQALIGSRIKLDLVFHVGPKLSASGELTDPYFDKNASLVSMEALPNDFEAQIQSEVNALQKSALGSMLQYLPGKELATP
jgi:hypothetical protein